MKGYVDCVMGVMSSGQRFYQILAMGRGNFMFSMWVEP